MPDGWPYMESRGACQHSAPVCGPESLGRESASPKVGRAPCNALTSYGFHNPPVNGFITTDLLLRDVAERPRAGPYRCPFPR